MKHWYRNELTVTTDDDIIGLQSFFWFYFPDEDYILIDRPINTFCMVRRTPDNFVKRIDAFFYTWGQAPKTWLKRIHSEFPQLNLTLTFCGINDKRTGIIEFPKNSKGHNISHPDLLFKDITDMYEGTVNLKIFKNELKVTTFSDIKSLVKFFDLFIEDCGIIINSDVIPSEIKQPDEMKKDRVSAKIEILKTEMGLMALIKAKFITSKIPPVNWLRFIHDRFHSLQFYLAYKDGNNKVLGKMYTEGKSPTDDKKNENKVVILDLKTILFFLVVTHFLPKR